MARAGTIESSLPPAAAEEGLDEDDLIEDGLDELDPDSELDPEEARLAEDAANETEARRQGWRPLAEYRGKPGGWVDAKVFIERGKNYLPFVQKDRDQLREQLGAVTNEMTGLREEIAAQAKQMQKLLDSSRGANKAGYDRAVADLKAKQREAVAAGDTATFDQVEDQLTQMQDARDEALGEPEPVAAPAPAARPTPKAAIDLSRDYQDFLEQNPWFNTDRVLNSAMIAEHNIIIEQSPGMSLFDQLEKAKEAVVARFPKKFGLDESPPAAPAPRQRTPAAPLAPTAPLGPRRPAGRTGIDAIVDPRERADARTGFASAKRSMPNLTEAEYLDVFNDPHADVLNVIESHKPKDRSRANGR